MSASPVDTLAPLTPLQHGMLHHSQHDPAAGVYVEQFACELQGPLDPARFQQAWAAVVQRHDVLKTFFIRLQEPQPVQVVRKQVTLPFVHDDWQHLDEATQHTRFTTLLHDDRARGLNPAQAPLMRLHLLTLAPARHRFLWTYHHAILDGWSMPLLLGEVFQRYGAPDSHLPPLRSDYRHYLAWLHRQDAAATQSFWREHLKGFRRPLVLSPAMAPSAPTGTRQLATFRGELPVAWLEAAQRLCRSRRLTLNTLCQGAYALLLASLADSDDLVHGLVLAGRSAEVPGLDRMVGLFINTLPMRVQLDPDQTLIDWLHQLQTSSQQIERLAHSALPSVLGCTELPRHQTLFDTLYVFENYPGQAALHTLAADHGLQVTAVWAQEETHYPLALIVLPGTSLQFHFTVDTQRFTAEAGARWVAHYTHLLQRLLDAAETPLREIGLPAALLSLPTHSAVTAAAPTQAALHLPDACWDASTWQALLQRAHAFWALRDDPPDARILLHAQEPAAALALLLSAQELGRHIVVADPALPLADVLTCDPWHRIVVTEALPTDGPFDLFSFHTPTDGIAHPQASRSLGTCTQLSRTPEGDWRQVTHTPLEIHNLPAHSRIALLGHPLDPYHLRVACAALQAGCELHAADTLAQLPALVWDLVRLTPAHTRALATTPLSAPLTTLAWHVEAASLTQAGRATLQRLNPSARIVRELCTPGAWPHGSWSDDPLHAPAHTQVRDRHLRPVAADAMGHLAVAGPTVPQALWRNGQPDRVARPQTREGPLLNTGLRGWVSDQGLCAIEAPQAVTALHWPSESLRTLEAQLQTAAGGPLALIEHLDAHSEWQTRLFIQSGTPVPHDLPTHIMTVVVESLPRGPTGQIDRTALLAGHYTPARSTLHTAPRDDLERQLHTLWRELLKRDAIGVHDNFFDLGGQSLLAAVLLHQVQEHCGRSIDMDTLLQAPTIAGMAQSLREGRREAGVPLATLQRDAALPEDIQPALATTPSVAKTLKCRSITTHAGPRARRKPQRYRAVSRGFATPRWGLRAGERAAFQGCRDTRPWQEILLTGATGFLGVHLLADLLQHTEARVHCLVRAPHAKAGQQRLIETLKTHGLWQAQHAARIVAVPGELGPARFGLSQAAFDALATRLDAIYHSGALVNFLYPYAQLKAANVDAVDEVLRLATRHHNKPVHHVSTIGVLDRQREHLPETLQVEVHERLMGGYEQSKWVAEQHLAQAAARGMPIAIYRPSRLMGHSRTGRTNPDDLFSRLIQGVVAFGKAPAHTGYDNMLPVDVAARLIVEASSHPDITGHAVHVINPQFIAFDTVLDLLASHGHALQRLPYPQWLQELTAHVQHVPTHPLAMLVPLLHKLNPVADPSLARPMPLGHGNLQRLAGDTLATQVRPPQVWLEAVFNHFYACGHLSRPKTTCQSN